MADRNLAFLFFCIARETDDLHAVTKGGLDRIQDISRGHEYHIRKIKRDTKVVVPEAIVLFRVEHFEQGRRWIATEIRAHLVDLVQHD